MKSEKLLKATLPIAYILIAIIWTLPFFSIYTFFDAFCLTLITFGFGYFRKLIIREYRK